MVLLACGHAATTTDRDTGLPSCPICNCSDVAPTPNLRDREARCNYCDRYVPSNLALPFFSYRPLQTVDKYYCGCRGSE